MPRSSNCEQPAHRTVYDLVQIVVIKDEGQVEHLELLHAQGPNLASDGASICTAQLQGFHSSLSLPGALLAYLDLDLALGQLCGLLGKNSAALPLGRVLGDHVLNLMTILLCLGHPWHQTPPTRQVLFSRKLHDGLAWILRDDNGRTVGRMSRLCNCGVPQLRVNPRPFAQASQGVHPVDLASDAPLQTQGHLLRRLAQASALVIARHMDACAPQTPGVPRGFVVFVLGDGCCPSPAPRPWPAAPGCGRLGQVVQKRWFTLPPVAQVAGVAGQAQVGLHLVHALRPEVGHRVLRPVHHARGQEGAAGFAEGQVHRLAPARASGGQ